MTELCVCACVWILNCGPCVCVCVCVYEKCLVVVSLQRICRIPRRKEESVYLRFLTSNLKKKLCVRSSVQLLGAP